jgi:hypothetical protein
LDLWGLEGAFDIVLPLTHDGVEVQQRDGADKVLQALLLTTVGPRVPAAAAGRLLLLRLLLLQLHLLLLLLGLQLMSRRQPACKGAGCQADRADWAPPCVRSHNLLEGFANC